MAGPSRRHVTGSLIAASLFAGCTSTGTPASGQVPGGSLPVFTSPSTGRRGLIYRPPGQASRRDWPLVIWLHGFSLRGDDPGRLMAYGLPGLISALPGADCVMIAPQLPSSRLSNEPETLDGIIADVAAAEGASPDRLIVMGASLGGGHGWDYMAARPARVAAFVGLASGAQRDDVRRAGPLTARLYHGDADRTVGPSVAEMIRDGVEANGGTAELVLLPGVGHDAEALSQRAFLQDDSLGWALAVREGRAPPARPVASGRRQRPMPGQTQLMDWVTLVAATPHRLPGTTYGQQAEDRIEDAFRAIPGLEVGRDKIDIPVWKAGRTGLSIEGETVGVGPVPYSGFTPARGLSAPLIFAGEGSRSDFRRIDARGRIAVIEASRTRCTKDGNLSLAYPLNMLGGLGPGAGEPDQNFAERYVQDRNALAQAEAAGAVGVIALVDRTCIPSTDFFLPYNGEPRAIPAVYAERTASDRIRQAARAGETAELTLTGSLRRGQTSNIWARLPARTASTLVISSHHDAVGPGVIEDASGVAQVLGAAWSWAQVPQAARPAELWFLAAAAHFQSGIGGITFADQHLGVLRRAKGLVTVEHVCAREAEFTRGDLRLTGRPQFSNIYTHRGTDRLARRALEAAPQPRTDVVGAPFGVPLSDAAGIVVRARERGVEIPFASWISAPLYLLDPRDTMDKLDPDRLVPTARTVAALANTFLEA